MTECEAKVRQECDTFLPQVEDVWMAGTTGGSTKTNRGHTHNNTLLCKITERTTENISTSLHYCFSSCHRAFVV